MNEMLETNENLTAKQGLTETIPNRKYKDRLFRMLFNDKEKLLELYNAMNETEYTNTEDLTITTLENALYLGMKNDISYVLCDQLLLYEHQSTKNPNMPLRNLLYVADVYSKLTANRNLFSRTLQQIPEPKFFVFYNGTEELPEHMELRLSDAYQHSDSTKRTEQPALELVTQVLNINKGFNEQLKEHCQTLREYMIFVDTVREHAKKMPFAEAMSTAMDICIKNQILAEFLQQNRAEVMKVSLYEYDEEKQLEMERNEAKEQGFSEGEARGLAKGEALGLKKGEALGFAKGEAKGRALTKSVFKMSIAGSSAEEIAQKVGLTVEQVMEILE